MLAVRLEIPAREAAPPVAGAPPHLGGLLMKFPDSRAEATCTMCGEVLILPVRYETDERGDSVRAFVDTSPVVEHVKTHEDQENST
jgi:hypothetical protein